MAGSAQSAASQPRIFISYARSDGETFAANLRVRLERENISLWQDRVKMEGGRDWWLQIVDALDHVEFMVLIMTPAALRSEIVRKEWRYARQQGVCVYPVKAHPDLDFKSQPRWMRDVHWYDLDLEWPKFLNDLNRTCEQTRVPFMVEDLPPSFVKRPREFEALISKLLDEKREEPVAITAALRGAGGYGKTTLAKALCHDERIQEAFDDGILWVTLGENPSSFIGILEDLIYVLSRQKPGFTSIDAAKSHFAELLADRDILLVIDDVWNPAHLKPFLHGGKRCARLITTRDERVVPLNAQHIAVDAMQQHEAVRLLTAGIDGDRAEEIANETKPLQALTTRLGKWPLLLTLVGSALRVRLRRGQSLPDAITSINKILDKRGLTAFDDKNPQERHQAVARALGVSFDLLKPDEFARYRELAIFPDGVDIPLATLQKLWKVTGNLDDVDTEDLCRHLYELSLLLNLDLAKHSFRLHDVVLTYLRREVGDVGLSILHQFLLDAYGMKLWADLPQNDPYLWDYLAYHLVGSGRVDELVSTLKNGLYLATKTFLRRSYAVESDLNLAIKLVPDDAILNLLKQNFARASHLFNHHKTLQDVVLTIHLCLRYLPELSTVYQSLEQMIPRPFITSWHALPDLAQSALIRTLSGHEDWVRGCAMSPDGTFIVSASDDKTVKVWDMETGREKLTLRGHQEFVNGCAVSPDGTFIVSVSNDKTVKVWDMETGKEKLILSGHMSRVNGCVVSPDGMFIVSASDDKTVKVWDVETGKEKLTLQGHVGGVNGCVVSPDATFIVSVSNDKTVKVWDVETGKEKLTLRGHKDYVNGCAISPDMTFIVSVSDDKTVKVWDVETEKEKLTLSGHKGKVNGCAVSPDSKYIISVSDDETVKVWDARTRKEKLTLSESAISANGAYIMLALDDRMVKVWDVETGREKLTLRGHTHRVNGCAVSPDGMFIVSASDDKTVKVWDTKTGEEKLTLQGHTLRVNGCAVSPDGKCIISVSDDGTVKVWNSQTGTLLITLSLNDRLYTCAFSPDGTHFVVGGERGFLYFLRLVW